MDLEQYNADMMKQFTDIVYVSGKDIRDREQYWALSSLHWRALYQELWRTFKRDEDQCKSTIFASRVLCPLKYEGWMSVRIDRDQDVFLSFRLLGIHASDIDRVQLMHGDDVIKTWTGDELKGEVPVNVLTIAYSPHQPISLRVVPKWKEAGHIFQRINKDMNLHVECVFGTIDNDIRYEIVKNIMEKQ